MRSLGKTAVLAVAFILLLAQPEGVGAVDQAVITIGGATPSAFPPAILGAHLGANFRTADWDASAARRFASCGLGRGALFRHFVANSAARQGSVAGRETTIPAKDWWGHICADERDRADDEGAAYRWMQTDIWQDLDHVESVHGENLIVVSGFPDLGKETAAALVAFCNGAPDDPRPIGVDHAGRDWSTVGHWAAIRAHGDPRHAPHPDPYRVRYWEIGNELYDPRSGASSRSWLYLDDYDNAAAGRNNATRAGFFLDGREVDGVHHDGYFAFRAAMKAVDPQAAIGPMLAPEHRGSWYVDWNDTILAKAKGRCDFVSCHTYSRSKGLAPERIVEQPYADVAVGLSAIRSRLASLGYAADFPLISSEWNAYEPSDIGLLRMQSALYDAQCIGVFLEHGLIGSCFYGPYDTVRADGSWATMVRSAEAPRLHLPAGHRWPSYYAFALWNGLGERLSEVHATGAHQGELRCYAASVAAPGRISLLVVNTAGDGIVARIRAPDARARRCRIDQVAPADGTLACSDVVYDGIAMSSPAGERIDRIEDIPPLVDQAIGEPSVQANLPAFSITRLRFDE